jgi:hypothetical protein
LQIVSAPASQVIVAVDLDTSGSDHRLARRGLERLASRGIKSAGQERGHRMGRCRQHQAVVPTSTASSLMRRGPRTARGWRIGVGGWRASAAPCCIGNAAKCPNAWARRMGLSRLLVRSTQKARTVQEVERQGLIPTIWPGRYQGSTAAGRAPPPRPEGAGSGQVGVDDLDQLLGGVGLAGIGVGIRRR